MHSNGKKAAWVETAARMVRSCVIILAMGMMSPAAAGQAPSGEYEVKAAFVYNFLKFVDLPSPASGAAASLRICILGAVPDQAPFDLLDKQELAGKRLAVNHLAGISDVAACQVLFIASSEERRLPAIVDAAKKSGMLTISDTEGFARRGVVINFIIENKKVRFEINAEAARLAGLKISSKLMKLASIVYGSAPAGDN